MGTLSGEKTEKPTPKKLREARREGRIARSPDLGAWAGILVASLLLPLAARHLLSVGTGLLVALRDLIAAPTPDPTAVLALLRRAGLAAALATAPLAGSLLLVGMVAAIAQGGLHPATKMLKPKASRLNPVAGFKRTFGTQALWEAAKVVLKTVVIGLTMYLSVRALMPLLLGGGTLPLAAVLGAVQGAATALFRTAAVAGLVLAAADYAVIRRKLGKQLRMTKQEVKEEHRQAEGDPNLRSAIRSRQLAMSRSRMMANLPQADAVVVNPTHVAVALRYQPGVGAPTVLAKGAGVIAARIRAVATEHRIPLIEDVPLARALFAACEIGQEIPAELYSAVARVLAFVLTLRARGSAAGTHRPRALPAALPPGRAD
ncbi:MAG: flagellar biosynthesis protein FlhB [Mycobacteriales bacterium]